MKAAFIVILLAASALAQGQTAVSAAEAACGPYGTQFDTKTDAAASPTVHAADGKALVYVVEDQQFKYLKDVTTRVGLDGAWVGANRGNSYFVFLVDPGKHHLCADWLHAEQPGHPSRGYRLVSLAELTAEAGEAYYFRARTTGAGDENPSLDLEPVNSDEGRLLVSTARLSISNPKPTKK